MHMRRFQLYLLGKLIFLAAFLVLTCTASAQDTYPVNGVADPREKIYAFTHATIVRDGQTTLTDATLVIQDGKIVNVGNTAAIPPSAVVIDCTGKYIYPSFIDIYSDYGIAITAEEHNFFPIQKARMAGTRPSNLKPMDLKYL
jgi:hypothetical protein